jgi:MFS family permease
MSRDLLVISLALMTWGVGEGMFLFFQPLYLQELGASPQEIGNILGMIGVAMVVAHLPAGYLADRIGRRPMLWMAWMVGLTSAWIMALSKSLPVFVLGSALYGLTSFVSSPLNSYITAARGNWSVGRAITLISSTYNIGAILGPLLGGWVGRSAGLHTNFLVAAFIFMLSTSFILFLRPQPVERYSADSSQEKPTSLLNPRTLRFLLVTFIAVFSMLLAQPLSQNFLQNQRGLDLIQIGQLLAVRSAGIVLLNLILGQLNARYGFMLAQAGMALFALLLWRGEAFQTYLLGYFLLGSFQTARALANAQGRALVQATQMGLAYGMIEVTMALANILAPPLAGLLYTYSPTSIYITSLALICAALGITAVFSPLRARDLI